MGKKSVSAESVEYFPNVGFVLRNVVGIDEDVVQIYDDYDINHICEHVIHESLKSGRCISKPFRHYQPLKITITVQNAVFHSSPGETHTRWYVCQRLIL